MRMGSALASAAAPYHAGGGAGKVAQAVGQLPEAINWRTCEASGRSRANGDIVIRYAH